MGILYLVATPIGNLEDITPRALRILGDVPLIAAEDTRHTGHLLRHFGLSTPLVSYHAHNERSRRNELIAHLASADLALVSDAGSPGISDPGHDLIRAAIDAGQTVTPIPGPSAVIAAVTASGLVPGPFLALGFLPRRGRERSVTLARAAAAGVPIALFESAERLAATLRDVADVLGDRPAAVMRELTKLHEAARHGTLRELAAHFDSPPRGEVVVVVGGTDRVAGDQGDAEEVVATLLQSGLSPSHVAREAAAITGRPRSELYDLARHMGAANDAGGKTANRRVATPSATGRG
jgi:16S rRNA (cytidine1402-2'-O)-methyltransferase